MSRSWREDDNEIAFLIEERGPNQEYLLFCSVCDKQLSAITKFCKGCGSMIGGIMPPDYEIPLPPNNNSGQGVGLTCFGVLLTIGAILGLVYFINFVSNPFFHFVFGGCGRNVWGWWHPSCTNCEVLSVIIVIAPIALIIGVIAGVSGISRIKNSSIR